MRKRRKCNMPQIPFVISIVLIWISFSMAVQNDPEKVTIFVHDISPDLERELVKRAKDRNHDISTEASEIIDRQINGKDGGIA